MTLCHVVCINRALCITDRGRLHLALEERLARRVPQNHEPIRVFFFRSLSFLGHFLIKKKQELGGEAVSTMLEAKKTGAVR